jgi:hypothetical protein
MRQVDDFAIAAPDSHTADLLLDMLDDKLSIPIKRQGLLDMYNGIDVLQSRHYVKISCTSFIDKICEKYQATWMKHLYAPSARPRERRNHGFKNESDCLRTGISIKI